ncbi:MAG: chitobiase/beta-hexosaminidase C-terminal domain-containing protein [Kiritimatiellia bacterium]
MKRSFVFWGLVSLTTMLSAASLCNGNSAGVAIDTTSGTRTAAAVETIRYGATWETASSGATAVVAVNDETLKSATGTGSVVWTPTRNGTYTLTHKVLAGGAQVGETLTATFVVEGRNPEDPVITPVNGTTFDSSLTISMSCPSDGATIHYTTNGSEPTVESPVYKRFRISGKTTVKARAFYENGEGSEVVTAEYALGRCDDPVISLADGTVFPHSDQAVSISCGEEGVLRYTLDGTEPTADSPVYAGPFTVSESTVVKAKVFSDRFFDSQVVTASLTREWVPVATPVITAAESFTGSKTKVVIACATEGATVRYTTNGNDPNSYSTKYTGPFYVTEGCTVKAYGVLNDYLNSEIAVRAISKVWGIGDTLGKPDHAFSTGGDAGFVRVTDATAPRGESMKSGAIGDDQASELTTQVTGPGTVSFQWRTSCEEDEEAHDWDHAEFLVDGVEVARQDGIAGWKPVSARVEGAGAHTLVWRYVKDDLEKDGEDCIWVADFGWTSDLTETQTTAVPVPYAWLLANCPDAVDEYDVYEAVAKQPAANGRQTVEECYVAGLDPEDPAAEFKARIEMVDGVPVVTPSPDLKGARVYKVLGKTSLEDAGEWQYPTNALHRFFKISVEMP